MSAGLLAIAYLVAATAPAAPEETPPVLPDVERLFGCPLHVEQEAFETPEHWSGVILPDEGITVRVPPGWTHDRRPGRFEAYAPDRSFHISLRSGTRVSAEELPSVRAALEISELGATFVKRACAERITDALRNEAPWTTLEFGYYGRPLGERRRRVALFAPVATGTLAVVISTRWPRGSSGPDWNQVWRLLGSLRLDEGPRAPTLAHAGHRRAH